MTLNDMEKLLLHFWKWLVIIPLVCAIAAGIFVYQQPVGYQAISVISASGEVNALGGIATIAAKERSDDGVTITAKADTTLKQVTITASGEDAKKCRYASISAARRAVNNAMNLFPAQKYSISHATSAEKHNANPIKWALIAFGGALFVVACIIICWSSLRRPVISLGGFADKENLPFFATLPSKEDKGRLLANLSFLVEDQCEKDTVRACFIPLSEKTLIEPVMNTLKESAKSNGWSYQETSISAQNHVIEPEDSIEPIARIEALRCEPLSNGMGAVYASRTSDVTVLVATSWNNTLKQAEGLLEELRLSNAQQVGFVLTRKGKWF